MTNVRPETAVARKIVDGLDAARKASSFENPVDEFGLIEAAIADAIHDLQMQIEVRDADIKSLQELYEKGGRKELITKKIDKAVEMRGKGLSYREIAQRLGYKSPAFVHQALKERGA